jgi:hypothetical protein
MATHSLGLSPWDMSSRMDSKKDAKNMSWKDDR